MATIAQIGASDDRHVSELPPADSQKPPSQQSTQARQHRYRQQMAEQQVRQVGYRAPEIDQQRAAQSRARPECQSSAGASGNPCAAPNPPSTAHRNGDSIIDAIPNLHAASYCNVDAKQHHYPAYANSNRTRGFAVGRLAGQYRCRTFI